MGAREKYNSENSSESSCLSSSSVPLISVSQKNLPFACPPPDATLWDAHPRVFLPFQSIGDSLTCPYCGASYVLVP